MEIVYLNTNGFYGNKDKRRFSEEDNQKNAKRILQEIFESYSYSPDVLFFSEFDANSQVGKFVIDFLVKEKNYHCVYPNSWKEVSELYDSIVIAFSKVEKKSETSPNHWLKWNEILIDGYMIVGIHIPDSRHELERAKDFWDCLKSHYQKNISNKVIYIGDMNVFQEGTVGKNKFNEIFETAKDAWLSVGHSNDGKLDYTCKYKSRIDYAMLSPSMPKVLEMHNHQEFFIKMLSDHSLLQIKF